MDGAQNKQHGKKAHREIKARLKRQPYQDISTRPTATEPGDRKRTEDKERTGRQPKRRQQNGKPATVGRGNQAGRTSKDFDVRFPDWYANHDISTCRRTRAPCTRFRSVASGFVRSLALWSSPYKRMVVMVSGTCSQNLCSYELKWQPIAWHGQ